MGRDGSIEYDDDQVRIPLQRMFDDAQDHRYYDFDNRSDRADLVEYKLAMFTVAQQNAELLIPAGKTYTGPSQNPGRQAMQQAYTDGWCLPNANRYNDDLGLEWSAPGLRQIDLPAMAKHRHTRLTEELAPGLRAAGALTDRLSTHTGLGGGEVLDQLNRQDADGKVELIAGWLLNTAPEDVPEEQVERIGAVLDQQFAAIGAGQGDRSGRELVGRLDHAVATRDLQTMSIGLLPPATGARSQAESRPLMGSRTPPSTPGVVRGK